MIVKLETTNGLAGSEAAFTATAKLKKPRMERRRRTQRMMIQERRLDARYLQ
jgi:hypothetical protein